MNANRERRRQEAAQRQEGYSKLTDEQKLARAIERGHEGTREVKKIRRRLVLAAEKAEREARAQARRDPNNDRVELLPCA